MLIRNIRKLAPYENFPLYGNRFVLWAYWALAMHLGLATAASVGHKRLKHIPSNFSFFLVIADSAKLVNRSAHSMIDLPTNHSCGAELQYNFIVEGIQMIRGSDMYVLDRGAT